MVATGKALIGFLLLLPIPRWQLQWIHTPSKGDRRQCKWHLLLHFGSQQDTAAVTAGNTHLSASRPLTTYYLLIANSDRESIWDNNDHKKGRQRETLDTTAWHHTQVTSTGHFIHHNTPFSLWPLSREKRQKKLLKRNWPHKSLKKKLMFQSKWLCFPDNPGQSGR